MAIELSLLAVLEQLVQMAKNEKLEGLAIASLSEDSAEIILWSEDGAGMLLLGAVTKMQQKLGKVLEHD